MIPGNVGQGAKRNTQFAQIIEIACRHDKPVRIGVKLGSLSTLSDTCPYHRTNARRAAPLDAGSVMREAMVVSALECAAKAEGVGLAGNRIVLSCKVSSVRIWWRSIATWPAVATTRFTSG